MLTLVTATLNAEAFLGRALASAAVQTEPLQHIVVDGGSRDATVLLCRQHPAIDVVVVPGCSIYEAWNVGIERARGDAVMFLNADDELAPDAASTVERALREHPQADILAGRAIAIDDEHPEVPIVSLQGAPNDALEVSLLTAGVPAINAMAFRRSLFEHRGIFETAYRVAGDRAFLLRLALATPPAAVASIGALLYTYHVHSGSLTLRRSLEQRLRVARDHLALSRRLLGEGQAGSAALWLRHMRQREAAVASLRCVASGRPLDALAFLPGLFY